MDDTEDRKGAALAFMKLASRETLMVCSKQAEEMAQRVESGALQVNASTALRFLAHLFASSAERD